MTAPALIFREALGVSLVAVVVLTVVGGVPRQHAGLLLGQRRPSRVIPAAAVAWWSR